MVKLTAIKKSYTVGDNKVEALKGIDLQFRKGEFVSILGPSGCGKTTMLNIIGGLDRYDSGDIEVNGVSTKAYKAADWDAYRNHSVGFVFQSYNLIGHQTVLSNVELALTLAGVSKSERRRRAKEALEQVGLGAEIKKKPNQLSGGQMQRVAIARALINDPEIILADEPTGALDSETSKQVMEILAEVAKKRLVIMVTHNGELAEEYSTRIIRLSDGVVISDSNPCNLAEYSTSKGKAGDAKKATKKSMTLKTAFTLSLNNLFTKKGRTFLTAFAGSIGIIGIALILSLSSGVQGYIDRVQEETLSTYPLTIMSTTMSNGMSVMFTEETDEEFERAPNTVYSSTALSTLYNSIQSDIHYNDLRALKAFIEGEEIPFPEDVRNKLEGTDIKTTYTIAPGKIKDVATVQYSYGLTLSFYCADTSDGVVKADTLEIIDTIYEEVMGMSYTDMLNSMSGMMGGALGNIASSASMDMWCELIDNQELLDSQYEMLEGHWPEKHNQVVLCVSENYKINEFVEFGMNLKSREELEKMLAQIKDPENNSNVEYERNAYTFKELLDTKFKLVLNCDRYAESNGKWYDNSSNPEFLKELVDNGTEIEIVGIIRPREDSVAQSMSGVLGYSHDLVEYIINATNESDIVKAQKANPEINVLTGKPFTTGNNTENELPQEFIDFADKLDEETKAEYYALLESQDSAKWMAFMGKLDDGLKTEFMGMVSSMGNNGYNTDATYESNLDMFGSVDFDTPKSINLYPVDFEAKDIIKEEVERFNNDRKIRFAAYIDTEAIEDGKAAEPEDKYDIIYSDLLAVMLSSVSTIINAISYVLIAFVSISLVVSSIMIGVITYISVLERTKEIGILRAMGASKRDIARVFNAETLIVGFVAGALGIIVTVLLNIPINIIINNIAEIGNIAKLPLIGGLLLVAISMFLTFIAGLIPSRIAAKKDPVVALRTE
ncbi:MAG: ATP-binding cassette domain-containing protein [Ruminococcaceae bacterium]|nr:ATP-binding cassette domain-containing protein [Oscillospiraceae bacterium]